MVERGERHGAGAPSGLQNRQAGRSSAGRFDSFVAPSPRPAGSAHRDRGGHAAVQQPLTLGTAGHIDHGKTTLVTALTGVDTDRLPEEKARGISIALGYAPLSLPSGRSVSVVDVP